MARRLSNFKMPMHFVSPVTMLFFFFFEVNCFILWGLPALSRTGLVLDPIIPLLFSLEVLGFTVMLELKGRWGFPNTRHVLQSSEPTF